MMEWAEPVTIGLKEVYLLGVFAAIIFGFVTNP